MLVGDLIFSSVSLAGGIVALLLGLFVFWKNPYLKVSQVFVASMSLVAIDAVFFFLLVNAPSDEIALLFARLAVLGSILVSASFLYLACYLPYERKDAWPLKNRIPFIASASLTAIVSAALIDGVADYGYGYWLAPSMFHLIWIGIAFVYSFVPVYMLTSICTRSKDKEVRWESTVLSIGVAIPFLFIVTDQSIDATQNAIPGLLTVGLLITSLIFTYATLGHKLFLIELVSEEKLDANVVTHPGIKMEGGHCKLVESKRADLAYRMFVAEVAEGNQGLLITRVHPDQVREKYGLVKTPILWLSGQPGPDRIDPFSLSILQHTLVDFLQKGPSSIILLDGLEYLVSENQLDKVLRLVYTVHDAVVISGSKFIVPIDPDILDPKSRALFEKEFEVIRDHE